MSTINVKTAVCGLLLVSAVIASAAPSSKLRKYNTPIIFNRDNCGISTVLYFGGSITHGEHCMQFSSFYAKPNKHICCPIYKYIYISKKKPRRIPQVRVAINNLKIKKNKNTTR